MYNTNVFRYLLHGFMIILLQTLGTDKPICYSVQLGVRLWNLDWLSLIFVWFNKLTHEFSRP